MRQYRNACLWLMGADDSRFKTNTQMVWSRRLLSRAYGV